MIVVYNVNAHSRTVVTNVLIIITFLVLQNLKWHLGKGHVYIVYFGTRTLCMYIYIVFAYMYMRKQHFSTARGFHYCTVFPYSGIHDSTAYSFSDSSFPCHGKCNGWQGWNAHPFGPTTSPSGILPLYHMIILLYMCNTVTCAYTCTCRGKMYML